MTKDIVESKIEVICFGGLDLRKFLFGCEPDLCFGTRFCDDSDSHSGECEHTKGRDETGDNNYILCYLFLYPYSFYYDGVYSGHNLELDKIHLK